MTVMNVLQEVRVISLGMNRDSQFQERMKMHKVKPKENFILENIIAYI